MTKNFQLVLWEEAILHFEDIKHYLTNLSGMNYILVTEHIGRDIHDKEEEVSKTHYHIYVQFDNDKRLSVKKLHSAHIVRCRGSPQQNISYLKCEDDKHKAIGTIAQVIYEEGTPRLTGNNVNISELMEIDDPEDLNDPKLYRIWRDIKTDKAADMHIDDWGKEVKVYYIQGPSGIGKTLKAKEIVKQNSEKYGEIFNRVKYQDGFYHGIGSAKICIYDDFRSGDMRPKEFVQFIDYNRNLMNVKGGSRVNNYELIIITSVERLSNIYRNVTGEPREQWVRRVEVIDMYDDNDVDVITMDTSDNNSYKPFYQRDGYEYNPDTGVSTYINKDGKKYNYYENLP